MDNLHIFIRNCVVTNYWGSYDSNDGYYEGKIKEFISANAGNFDDASAVEMSKDVNGRYSIMIQVNCETWLKCSVHPLEDITATGLSVSISDEMSKINLDGNQDF